MTRRSPVVGIGADGDGTASARAPATRSSRATTVVGSRAPARAAPRGGGRRAPRPALAAGAVPRRDRLGLRARALRPGQRRPDAPRHRRDARAPASAPTASTSTRTRRRSPSPARASAGRRPTSALVSAVARAPEARRARARSPRRAIAYATGEDGARAIARVLTERGYGPSRLVVLERSARRTSASSRRTAETFDAPADPLHAVAIEAVPAPGAPLHALVPGLPDDAYDSDGQLTKRHVRAATLAALAPTPGALLWDVGAGSGSIAIEWLRAEPTARAVAIERDDARADRVERNARALGVPIACVLVRGRAPDALAGLEAPTAVFVGGGAHRSRVARRLLGRAAPRRPDRRQRGHPRERAGPRRRARRAGRLADPHRDRARRADRRPDRLARADAGRPVGGEQVVTVHFIAGAGPGAPDLLTLRARDRIAACPVCLYAGALVPPEILAHAPAGARVVDTQ